ncbi:glycerophosphodiester phosphodiesterase family protein [Pedobacter faecalis]|uniref:glycerophosphodiester phosphodiesterase family protein n=1 Tax=Pedobacter faecalis TaxID=3041495 RepID=UPI00254B8AF8|nr:glycerophosphodiester phosphodiesterase family protein [Pedobacter sp. ELA7]
MKTNSLIILLAFLLNVHASGQKVDLQGNRGARGIMPENTIEGMLRALDLGVTTLVMSVVITRDKQVVLSQEPYFNHEFSLRPDGKPISLKEQKDLNIYKMDYAEVSKFDIGSKIHPRFPAQQKYRAHKPLLSETVDAVEAYAKKRKLKKPAYSIEIKTIPKGDKEFHPEPDEFADLVMNVVNEQKIAKRATLQSFDTRVLQYLHSAYPKIRTGLLVDEKVDFEASLAELGFTPAVYSPYHVLVGKGLIDRCHKAGVKVIPWTVNSAKDMAYLLGLGVDGLVTDYPNLYATLDGR